MGTGLTKFTRYMVNKDDKVFTGCPFFLLLLKLKQSPGSFRVHEYIFIDLCIYFLTWCDLGSLENKGRSKPDSKDRKCIN